MKANESNLDRIIRAVVGVALLLVAFLAAPTVAVKTVLIILGVVLLFTAVTGFCLLYRLFGLSTRN